MASAVDAVFRPPGESWQPVSPSLITARRLVLVAVAAPLLLLALAGLSTGSTRPVAAVLIAVGAAGTGWGWWMIGRRVRSYGYAERDDDLLVTSGILVRRLTIVPYGRMQLVEVTSGPIDRAFGLTTVKLHTASPTTDATIPGLPADESSALRDRLAALGEARSAGM